MAADKKSDILKDILVYAGILSILTGSLVIKDGVVFFLIGFALLAMQTVDLRGIDRNRITVAGMVLSFAAGAAAAVHLALAKSFGTSQFFLVLMLLGAILIVAELVRKLTK